ncbi:hypothetical protein SLA2020_453910 [Shorea laevis]
MRKKRSGGGGKWAEGPGSQKGRAQRAHWWKLGMWPLESLEIGGSIVGRELAVWAVSKFSHRGGKIGQLGVGHRALGGALNEGGKASANDVVPPQKIKLRILLIHTVAGLVGLQ